MNTILRRGLVAALALGTAALLSGCSLLPLSGGPVVVEGNTDVMELAVGDCILEPEAASEEDAQIGSIDVVDCAAEHHLEVFALVRLDLDYYPSADEVYEESMNACLPYFADYVGTEYEDSQVWMGAYTPTPAGWAAGDHESVCLLWGDEPTTTGSFRGSERGLPRG